MSDSDYTEFEGVVEVALPNATFKVRLVDNDLVLLAYLSGKMRKGKIKVLLGDKVTVAVSPYDLQKGRIIYRHR